jgi:hypothetical protein
MRPFVSTAIALTLVFCVANAEAGPITGGMSISGDFKPVNGVTGAVTTLDEASGLDFVSLIGGASSPGTAGQFLMNSTSGDFDSLVGMTGLIHDFSFKGLGSTNFPTVPLLSFQTVGGLTFDLTSILSVLQPASMDLLDISGIGVLSMAGFTDTAGTFDFSAQGAQGTFSFSASNGGAQQIPSQQVPEPSSLALTSEGLLFCAAAVGRRRRATR